ncbi:SDR family NAD(P)-dependent oxidoreductase [Salibacterium halotolerans]|uniref:Short-chain dehydrogenase n=1 Tax=Salibacterium halotolerans TaxID=1884432 RepID=A0A1I5WR70_9BACI|nr:SDR family NAD(P)-dependent oxidoreductase [Salibacterium halotolerans]SFQ22200.1 Short-chain dehydrogenase [Salibacterium halotolerans]
MGTYAVVTGSSGGFGSVFVRTLLEKGYDVIAGVRDMAKGEFLVQEAKQIGKQEHLHLWQLDVTNPDDIERLTAFLEKSSDSVDVLINNAGYCQGGVVEGLSEEQWQEQFDVNMFGVIRLTKALLPLLRRQRFGRVINISSISGRIGLPGMSAYASTKFALEGFSESLRYEMLPFQVYVSLIEPGSYRTGIWEKALQERAHADEAYDTLTSNLEKEASRAASGSSDPEVAATVLENILKTKKPRLRYPMGTSARMYHYVKPLIPYRLLEWIILRRIFR